MKKYFGFIVFSILSLSAAAVFADSDIKPVLEKRYAEMKAAMQVRDGKAIRKLLAPDFVSTDHMGKRTDATGMIESLDVMPVDPNKHSKTTIEEVEVNGDTALVKQSYNMKTTKAAPDGNKNNIEFKASSHDMWVKNDGNWLLKETVTDNVDYLVNGKSLVHPND